MKKLVAFALSAVFSFGYENSFFIDLNQNDIEGGYETLWAITNNSSAHIGVQAMRSEDEFDEMQTMASGHIRAIGITPIPGIAAGVGFRAVGAWVERGSSDELLFALPLEAGVIYTLPIVINTTISAFFDLAPSALCLKNCDRYTELRIQAAIEPIDGGMIFAGWRDLNFKDNDTNGKYRFNRAFYGGVRISF